MFKEAAVAAAATSTSITVWHHYHCGAERRNRCRFAADVVHEGACDARVKVQLQKTFDLHFLRNGLELHPFVKSPVRVSPSRDLLRSRKYVRKKTV